MKEELDHKISQYEKLRADSQEWYTESRRAAAYRDEVDVLRERADRADRLEIEVQRFREKLSDAEFFKTRVEELREDNRMLLETKCVHSYKHSHSQFTHLLNGFFVAFFLLFVPTEKCWKSNCKDRGSVVNM